MELHEITNAAKIYGADDEYSLVAGDVLKVEAGEDEFSEVVPAGKRWEVRISMKIEEHTV